MRKEHCQATSKEILLRMRWIITLTQCTDPQSTGEIKTSYPDVLPFTLVFMSPEEILAEKIRALLTRNYARDLYDLHFLLMNNTPVSAELIEQKISYYQKKFIKKEFVQKIQEKKDIWKAELEPLIMGTLPTFNEVKKTVLMKLNAVELKIEHKVLDEKRK